MSLDSCYFCGVADDTALSEHHIIPKRVDPDGEFDDKRAVLCRNCHKKVHDIVDPVVDYYPTGI